MIAATITIDECEAAFVEDFMPYKGRPDPLVVWRAAWGSARRRAEGKAFAIADEAMFELIVGHSVRGMGDDKYGLADDDSREVRTLAEACDALRDAVEWLAPRGYVRIDSDEDGEFIVVIRRPGE